MPAPTKRAQPAFSCSACAAAATACGRTRAASVTAAAPATTATAAPPRPVARGAHLPRKHHLPRAARRARAPLRRVSACSSASDDPALPDVAAPHACDARPDAYTGDVADGRGGARGSGGTPQGGGSGAARGGGGGGGGASGGCGSGAAGMPEITSLSLNLNGRDALPSVASLNHYMNDLRPKLDYLDARSRGRVLSALEVANVAHHGQLRKSGEPFIIHPIAVAVILADMRMDRDCIIAGLLHDTVEDTPVTLDDVETLFGADVRRIVEGETKLTKLAKKVRDARPRSGAAHGFSVADPPPTPLASPSSGPPPAPPASTPAPPSASAASPFAPSLDDAPSPGQQPRPTSVPSWQRERAKREEEQQKQADNLRAMFMAMTEDVRVIIVKLADRLHNMRTLAHMSVAKQKKISKETLEFFAPLAHRLGMRRIKSELEELSFMYLHPEEYNQLKYEVETMLKRSNVDHYLKSAEGIIKDVLHQDRILYNMIRSVQVIGSTKELYTIYRRMQAGETLGSMLDIATMRVVVDLDPGVNSNQACYHVLGRIHNMWKPLPKRLKDYIAFPKPNGYQSLHTTVLLGQKFDFFALEIQIRTAEMHRIAEEGIAAEVFKTGPGLDKSLVEDEPEDEPDAEWRRRTKGWLISIREYLQEFSSSKDLVDAVRKDLLGNRVFVFTPKGSIVDLPKDSTPVDVAYRIHSDVGDTMIGAKVNGRVVGLDYRLQNADVVKIVSSSSSQGPSPEWISYAKSRTARQKIRQFLRARDRDNMLDRGCRMLEEEARAMREPNPSEAALEEVLPRLCAVVSACQGARNIGTVDDLYVAIARGATYGDDTYKLERTVLGLLRDQRHTEISDGAAREHDAPHNETSQVAQRLADAAANVEMIVSPCCHPIRGDEVRGVHLCGGASEAVLVHRLGCGHLTGDEREVELRWAVQRREQDDGQDDGLEVRYGMDAEARDGADSRRGGAGAGGDEESGLAGRVVVVARDCTGLLAYVSGVLASSGTSIQRAATLTDRDSMVATLAFEVVVRDTYHLRRILEQLEECDEVESARRLGPNEGAAYFGDAVGADPLDAQDVSLRLLRAGLRIRPAELEIGADD